MQKPTSINENIGTAQTSSGETVPGRHIKQANETQNNREHNFMQKAIIYLLKLWVAGLYLGVDQILRVSTSNTNP